jgi:hypothetical protein
MTTLSRLTKFAHSCQNNHKGSTYGKASITPGPNSIQFSRRGYKSLYANRIKALSSQITIFTLYPQSIMILNGLEDQRTTRNN